MDVQLTDQEQAAVEAILAQLVGMSLEAAQNVLTHIQAKLLLASYKAQAKTKSGPGKDDVSPRMHVSPKKR